MTAITMAAPRVGFDIDAMLMYGWVSDAQRNVTQVSNSLRRWIRDHVAYAPDATRLLARIDAGDAGVQVGEFLKALLDAETEKHTPELVDRYIRRLEQRVVDRGRVDTRSEAQEGAYRVVVRYHAPHEDAQPLVGARFVRDSATLLASQRNAERVDIVVVAILERHDGWWRIKGFQGQLQEAWLRVSNRVVDGNRAGSIALMARNLSHNIGSHALYWVASSRERTEKDFLSYLQVRMELLAGFATSMPLSPVPADVSVVVQRFAVSELLLRNICRSEAVMNIDVKYAGGAQDAIFFGGEIGIHAFYSILENCVRDSAKFAPKRADGGQTLTLNVVAKELGRFVRIDVYDEAGSFAEHGHEIRANLEKIRISDESGKLDPNHWGIKERFVCAAILRGYRPENFPLQETASPKTPQLGTLSRDGYRVLEVENVDGNCAWRFYLPRRHADVLLVTDAQPAAIAAEAAVQSFAKFKEASESATGISAPFVVLDRLPENSNPRILEARLPHRTYVRDASAARFLRVEEPLERITPELLLRKSVEKLTRQPVRLVLGLKESETAATLQCGAEYRDPLMNVAAECELFPLLARLHQQSPHEKLVVFKRHDFPEYENFLRGAALGGVGHFEVYHDKPALEAAIHDLVHNRERAAYRLLEAALTKILILDERLDLSLNASGDPLARQKLLLRGIEVSGSEFAGHSARERRSRATLDDVCLHAAGHHIVMLHRGIAEKLMKDEGVDIERIVSAIEARGVRVVIHSGRMGVADERTKFLSLANVTTWIDHDYPKLQIIDELFALRRV